MGFRSALERFGGSRKGGAFQAAEKPSNIVILSEARDLALSIFKTGRDSSSPAAPQIDKAEGFFRSLFSAAIPTEMERPSGGEARVGRASRLFVREQN